MKKEVKKEVERLIKVYKLNCPVEEFKDKVDWNWISLYQILSENFIREFQNNVDWESISEYHQLSEDFILEFEKKLDIEVLIERELITKERLRELKEFNTIHSRFNILDI